MRSVVLLLAAATVGLCWWFGWQGFTGAGVEAGMADVAIGRENTGHRAAKRVDVRAVLRETPLSSDRPVVCVPARSAERVSAGAPGGKASIEERARSSPAGVIPLPVAERRAWTPDASSGGGRPPLGSAYQPEPVQQGVEPQPSLGIRLRSGADLAFAYDPQDYRDGAMNLVNEVGRPVAVRFSGPGCADLRLNGQPISEGRSYLIGTEAQVRGSRPVGIEVRQVAGAATEPLPAGAG